MNALRKLVNSWRSAYCLVPGKRPTLAEIAKAADVGVSSLGEGNPTLETMAAVAKGLDCTLELRLLKRVAPGVDVVAASARCEP